MRKILLRQCIEKRLTRVARAREQSLEQIYQLAESGEVAETETA